MCMCVCLYVKYVCVYFSILQNVLLFPKSSSEITSGKKTKQNTKNTAKRNTHTTTHHHTPQTQAQYNTHINILIGAFVQYKYHDKHRKKDYEGEDDDIEEEVSMDTEEELRRKTSKHEMRRASQR